MIRNWLCILIILNSLGLRASHVIGGDLSVSQTGRNTFDIDLSIYIECDTGLTSARNQYALSVYQVNKFDASFSVILNTDNGFYVELGEPCFSPPSLCIKEYHSTGSVTVPDYSEGYIFVVQEFARNYNITNIFAETGAGMTWTTYIPDPALANGNSTPHFNEYPPNGYLCINKLNSVDLSAVDPDGDSLFYEFVTPLNAPSTATGQPFPPPPPYALVSWKLGYSLTNMINGNPTLTIDPVTGIATCAPNEFGIFVFSYLIHEYRNGVKIGELRRDLQFEVLNCTENSKPVFTMPGTHEFSTQIDEQVCIQVQAKDPDHDDTLIMTSNYSVVIEGLNDDPNLRLVTRLDTGTITGQLCWTPDCAESLGEQVLNFHVTIYSYGCDETDTISDSYRVTIDPMPQDIIALMPNVFTPNNDGLNDVFKLQSELPYPCISSLELRIFNRWGVEVYKNALSDRFGWDGSYEGKEASQGVYYYTITGSYGSAIFEKRSFLTLVR